MEPVATVEVKKGPVSVKSWVLGAREQEVKRENRLRQQRQARAKKIDRARTSNAEEVETVFEGNVEDFEGAAPETCAGMEEEYEEEVAAEAKQQPLQEMQLEEPQFRKSIPSQGHSKADEVRARLSFPEPMLGRPPDLSLSWVCAAKPQGIRCLLQAHAKSKCTSTTVIGAHLHSFSAKLPIGTMFDCIFSPLLQTYFIVDCLAWGGLGYEQGTEFEFRQFWLSSKLSEGIRSDFALSPLNLNSCERDGLMAAYSLAQQGPNRDGLLFFHKEADYDAGQTPLVLYWYDQFCSSRLSAMVQSGEQCAYLIPDAATPGCEGANVLLRTHDGFPLCESAPPPSPNLLVHCFFNSVGFDENGRPRIHDVRVDGFVSSLEKPADTWGQVMFEAGAMSTQLVAIAHLLRE